MGQVGFLGGFSGPSTPQVLLWEDEVVPATLAFSVRNDTSSTFREAERQKVVNTLRSLCSEPHRFTFLKNTVTTSKVPKVSFFGTSLGLLFYPLSLGLH